MKRSIFIFSICIILTIPNTICFATDKLDINEDSSVSINTWFSDGTDRYYHTEKGILAKGWQKIKTTNSSDARVKWCYFNRDGKYIKSVSLGINNKWIKVDNKRFYFVRGHKPIRAGIPYYNYKYKTYILVDISQQKFSFYKKKKLKLEGNVVTGKKNTPTPTGVYKISQKKINAHLYGPTWHYSVKRWIAFIGKEYGFHDASWQNDKYFNNNKSYIKHGSHGCVNMRIKDIKRLYNKVRIGTTVIIRK